MLRSSREGRKQAARFHAFPSSKNFPSFLSSHSYDRLPNSAPGGFFAYQQQQPSRQSQQPIPIDLNSPLLPSDERPKYEQQKVGKELDTRIANGSAYAPVDDDVTIDLQASSTEPCGIALKKRKFIEDDSITNAQRKDGSMARIANVRQDRMNATPLAFDVESSKEKTPSRGTTEDNSQSSALSSPPTSHPDEQGDEGNSSLLEVQKLLGEGSYSIRGCSSDSHYTSNDLDSSCYEDDNDEPTLSQDMKTNIGRTRKPHNRLKPRDVQGVSLLASRRPRSKVKSLKVVEAEETLALSPKSRRRAQREAKNRSELLSYRGSSDDSARDRDKEMKSDVTALVEESGDEVELVMKKKFAKKGKGKEISNGKEVIVKKKRGRPLGSTKQKKLERLQKEVEEVRCNTEISEAEEEDELPGKEQESDVPDERTMRRLRRLTEPFSSNDSNYERQSRYSMPGVSSKDDRLVKKKEKKKSEDKALRVDQVDVFEKDNKGDLSSNLSWKKKMFLTAGLYSDDYKHEEVIKKNVKRSAKDIARDMAKRTSRTRKGKSTSALPYPADYGHYLLIEKKDFRLPFPIAQKIPELRLKMEAKKKPPPYKHISQNRYFSRSKLPGEILICQCPPNGDCGDSCVNRQTEYLCHPKHCPCGDRCTNIYFGKRKAIKTEVQWYGARGFGLKTLEPISKGGFIDEYRGEVIEFNEAVRRVRDHYKEIGNYYFLMYDAPAGEMLDGGLKGNITRFANHSCDPNCKVQKWLICGTDEARSGEFQVALFAERDIQAGEELTYDYGWSAFAAKAVSGESSAAAPEECHCGASNCSGFLGVKKATVAAGAVMAKTMLKRAKKKQRKMKPTLTDKAEAIQTDDSDVNSVLGNKFRAEGYASSSLSSSSIGTVAQQLSKSKITSPSKKPPMLLKEHFATAIAAAATTAFQTPIIKSSRQGASSNHNKGLMDKILGGNLPSLIDSPSSLTSLSSDDDRFDLENSADNSISGLANKISQSSPIKSFNGVVQHGKKSIGKRKRASSIDTLDTQETIDEDYRLPSLSPNSLKILMNNINDDSSQSQEILVPSRKNMEKITTILQDVPKKKKLKVKDRVIRVLVPIDEPKENNNLILEGKRERRLTEKAASDQPSSVMQKRNSTDKMVKEGDEDHGDKSRRSKLVERGNIDTNRFKILGQESTSNKVSVDSQHSVMRSGSGSRIRRNV